MIEDILILIVWLPVLGYIAIRMYQTRNESSSEMFWDSSEGRYYTTYELDHLEEFNE